MGRQTAGESPKGITGNGDASLVWKGESPVFGLCGVSFRGAFLLMVIGENRLCAVRAADAGYFKYMEKSLSGLVPWYR